MDEARTDFKERSSPSAQMPRLLIDDRKILAAEIQSLRDDIKSARRIIRFGLIEYRRKKLNQPKMKGRKNSFHALYAYSSRLEIYDAFGHGYITKNQMRKLMELWDKRENVRMNGLYHDRVTDILEQAIWRCGHELMDYLDELEDRLATVIEE